MALFVKIFLPFKDPVLFLLTAELVSVRYSSCSSSQYSLKNSGGFTVAQESTFGLRLLPFVWLTGPKKKGCSHEIKTLPDIVAALSDRGLRGPGPSGRPGGTYPPTQSKPC
jgi:hypothetical protein